MSAGSNNIVIKISDGIDPQIEVKIKGIGDAARQSATDVSRLIGNLSLFSGQTQNLTRALTALNTAQKTLNQAQNASVNGTNSMTRAFANLAARIGAAELGVGRLGGVLATLGTAAAGAGPFIVAALAVAAVVGAVEVYDKFDAAARKLTDDQIDLAKQIGKENDGFLNQNEIIAGLTKGPLAEYQLKIADLSQKQIVSNIEALNKVLEDQKSVWANIVANVETYVTLQNTLHVLSGSSFITPKNNVVQFSLQDSQDLIKQTELVKSSQQDQAQAVLDARTKIGNKLTELHNLEQQLDGRALANTEVSRKSLQSYYDELTRDYQKYLKDKEIAQAQYTIRAGQEQLRQFQDEVNLLKSQTGKVNPQEILDLRKQQFAGTTRDTAQAGSLAAQKPINLQVQRELQKDIGSATQDVARQNQRLDELVARYREAATASGAYSDKLKEEAAHQKANDEVLRESGSLREDILKPIYKSIDAQIENQRVNQATIAIYDQFQGPLQKYNAALAASNRLLKDQQISAEQKAIADAKANRTLQDSLNPLNEYNIGLQHEVSLLQYYGTALTVATEVDRVRQQLQKQGYDLSKIQVTTLTQYLTLLEQQKQIQSDLNSLWEQNAGAVQKLTNFQLSLNKALEAGVITKQQYKIATAQNNVELANEQLIAQKGATLQQQVIVTFGTYLKNYQGLTKGFTDAYANAFSQIADGASQAIGRALFFSENLNQGLLNVARTVGSELVGAFIKLGIQWLITEAIGKSLGAGVLASSLGQAVAISEAWAPAAAFSSLATLGANAAPAAAAVATTVGLADALALFKFAQGGLVSGPGTGTSDSVLAALSNGEFVVNARATAQNLGLLKAINGSNSVSQSSYSAPGSVGSSGTNLMVQVVHDGSTNIDVQQIDQDTIRIIAQREAKLAVRSDAAGVVASDLSNPNSRTSKAVQQHLVAPRKR
jgi:hypothetical protein